MLIDDGLLVREDGRWAATRDLAAVPVPPTIQALLAARLDRLDADERAVIERAAVEGKVFHEGAVVELAPESLRPAVATHLAALVRKELIRPDKPELMGERAFRFRHLLIRDAAYDSIPKDGAGGAARAVRALARAHGGRADGRVRGDHRLPPRADLPVPGRARTGRRRDPAARARGRGASRARPATGRSSAATPPRP